MEKHPRLLNYINRSLIILTFFTFIILGSVALRIPYSFYRPTLSIKVIQKIQEKFTLTVVPDLISDAKKKQISIFLYYDNYTARQLLASGIDILNPDVKNIGDDPFFKLNLLYHENNTCLILPTQEIEKSSSFYNVLLDKDLIDEKYFYVSCPIYVKDILLGYVSGVYVSSSSQISPKYLEMQVLASLVAKELKPYF